MADSTLIAWTDHTFNPWMGCFKVSQGCKHCYAETLTARFGKDVFGADVTKRRRTSAALWKGPWKWNGQQIMRGRPARVFCASLADVFEDAPGPNAWRPELWDLIRKCRWLDWQILTKRPENMERMLPDDWDRDGLPFWPNVWLGTSIEDNRVADRSDTLTDVPAFIHFISYEPAIGSGDEIPLEDIEWLICGGESGPGFRKMDLEWAHDMRARCAAEAVPYFFKQNSGPRTEMGIDALGEVVREYPDSWDRVTDYQLRLA